VAIIIIMNTLSMAAMERINEIGMMRAVGAQKKFVGEMFFYESAFLSAIFGAIGIAAGAITVFVLSNMGITTENNILQLLFGGSVFRPMLDFVDILIGIFELALVALIATVYPIMVARKITPLEAIARD
jgi:ABC-type lipoprotein release transport system permease subunit